jgi:hypothetical protein
MSSFACLRIELPPELAEKLKPVRGSVQKVTEAYLETRWAWPRRFTPVSDMNFVLIDPRVTELPVDELSNLADELQVHLFGTARKGDVSLLLFEGSTESVIAFASLKQAEITAMLADPGKLPLGGRLRRIRSGDERNVEHLGGSPALNATSAAAQAPPSQARAAAKAPEAKAPPQAHIAAPAAAQHATFAAGLLGTYLLSRDLFIADMLAVATLGEAGYQCVVEDEFHMPQDDLAFDEACVRGACRLMAQKTGGLPFAVPISFANIARPERAHRFAEILALLPKERRSKLNATVYRVPRELPNGVEPLRPLLDPHFCSISLITTYPQFAVEQFTQQSVACVILCLREPDATARLSAMRAFAGRHDAFQQRGIRQALANVRTRAELDWARKLDMQVVSGPAVCGFLDAPVAGRPVPLPKLPLMAADIAA